MKKNILFFSLLITVFLLVGCAGSTRLMKPADDASYEPLADKAVVIFMRPQTLGFAVQSVAYDIIGNENKLVGIVSAKKKVAYITNPGEHLFMVIGESADFMKADLTAGKTYYALVTPRMGWNKARFSLTPVQKNQVNLSNLESWKKACIFTENTESSRQWAEKHARNVEGMRVRYYEKWKQKPKENQPSLKPEDGF